MHEIKCPHCGKSFTIDEASYADIVRQVRNKEFSDELHERLAQAETEKKTEIALAVARASEALKDAAAAKDQEIAALKTGAEAAETAKRA